MDLELEGKTAIVTGGSRGIGKAIAKELALSGCDVVICARNAEDLDLTARELSIETGRRVIGITADTTNSEDVNRMVKQAAEALGSIDILVNNAAAPGGLAGGPLATISDDDVLEDLNTKVVGYLRCARAVGSYMTSQGWGRIVNIGGLSARASSGNNLSAGVRNSGLVNLTKYLADQLGGAGVTVNLVHPGATRTERSGPAYEERARQQGITVKEVEARVAANNSTKRIVDASELAYVVAFLASPRSIAISGEVIAAGGGSGQAVFH
ncbi:MAG: short-chain dehydrogenase [SAR202 cluster bacterium Io17-Chloro-G9]|nr:MAG: short-chain dehydrogenase [SAR202 cluster bacterium Io17-Chloro-G9]